MHHSGKPEKEPKKIKQTRDWLVLASRTAASVERCAATIERICKLILENWF